ncbi:hypothetical protein JHK86_055378 [Glycine max]|nr:hypothetical protein JHK86_055378 [Glycine max]
MTSTALANLRQVDEESLRKFMDRFGCTTVQIRNLNPEIALYSMLLTLHPRKFRNEVRQAKQKHKKRKGSTKINLHKSKKRHKPDKRLSFPKRPRYERYMPLTTNFNLEVPIRLPLMKPPRLGLGATKYCRTTTKHEQDLEDTKRSNIGTKKQTEEEWKIESSQSQKCHLHAIWDIDINIVDAPLQQSLPLITFTDRDFKGINPINQDDLVVVSTSIENFMVSRVLINQGNSTDILYWKDFHRLKVSLDNVHLHKLKLAPYPPIREPAKPHHTTAEGTQVMSVDKGSKIQVLTVYQDSMGDEFDINPRDHTSDRGQKPIE